MARNKASMTLPSADGSGTMGVAHVKLRSGMREGVHTTPSAANFGSGDGRGSCRVALMAHEMVAAMGMADAESRGGMRRGVQRRPQPQIAQQRRAWLMSSRAVARKQVRKWRLQPQFAAANGSFQMQAHTTSVQATITAANGSGNGHGSSRTAMGTTDPRRAATHKRACK